MGNSKVEQERQTLCCSSSISNFKDKLKKRTGLEDYSWFSKDTTLFVGMYHIGDYLRFFTHRGKRKVFWCGSDIKNLTWLTSFLISRIPARHYCENLVERHVLWRMGIYAQVRPMIFEDYDSEIRFNPSTPVEIYMTVHEGRELEYGLPLVEWMAVLSWGFRYHIYGINGVNMKNLVYHGKVSNEEFNRDIKNYHAALRLNEFDGFSEILAKSALLGQYPISKIYYPNITHAGTLKDLLDNVEALKQKKEPNYEGRDYWKEKLQENLETILNG